MQWSPQLRRRVGLALLAAPVALQALVVALLGVNTILWDEFYYVDFIREVREGGNWWPWLLRQHNEHRLVPAKLVVAPLALLTDWDTRAEMYVSVVLAAAAVWGLWHLYRQLGGRDLLCFVPVAWLVCSLAQYENMLSGLMMCHYFTLAGVVWALVLLGGGGAAAVAGAAACALVASFSILDGLLVWPLGAALLFLRRRSTAAAAWLAVGAGAFAVYFHDFALPGGQPRPSLDLAGVLRIGRYGVKLLGGPFAAGSFAWSAVIGLVIAAGSAAAGWWWLRSRERLARDAPAVALLLFGALSCVMIALGRAAFESTSPLQSRYVMYSSAIVAALYFFVARNGEQAAPGSRARSLFLATLVLMLPGLLAANTYGLYEALVWRRQQIASRDILISFDRRTPAELGTVYFADQVPPRAAYLRAHGLGPFAPAAP